MATVSGVPGQLDNRKGWQGPGYPPELIRTLEAQKAARGQVKHPAELAVERAEAERQREAERRAQGDFRQLLRDAHGVLAQAKSELDRLVQLRQKAAAHLGDLEREQQRLFEEQRLGERAQVDRLVQALATGVPDDLSPQPAVTDQITRKLTLAKDAVGRLSEEHRAAIGAVREAEAGVARCAVALAVDHAVAEAARIEELAAELHRRRASLNSLGSAITSQLRAMPYVAGLYLPPAVGRALGAIDSRVDVAWAARLKQLSIDPEAELLGGEADERGERDNPVDR